MPNNENGSALSFTVILMLVLSLLISNMLAMASASHRRSVAKIEERQANYSAFTIAETIALDICNNKDGLGRMILEAAKEYHGSYIEKDIAIEGLDAQMGQCYMGIEYKIASKMLYITINATVNEKDSQVTVQLSNKSRDNVREELEENYLWEIEQYYGK